MITVTYQFPDRISAKTALDDMVLKGSVTGELEIKPLENGVWLLKVHSEKDVKDVVVEKLGGKRLD